MAVAALMLTAPIALHAGSALDLATNAADRTGSNAGLAKKSIPVLVGSYIKAAIGLLGIILVVLIIYAGFLWMTAQGDTEKVKKAKGILSNAIVGLILIFASYAITGFVIDKIISSQSTPPNPYDPGY